MTGRAPLGRAAFTRDVRGMDELHVKALDESCRKFPQCRRHRFHVVVTDRAHGLLLRVRKLTNVAADARVMAGEFQIEGRTFTLVA